MTEKTKLVRINEESWKTLQKLGFYSKKAMGVLIDEWAIRLQGCMDEDCINANHIELLTFRPKGKALLVASVLIPEFFGVLTLADSMPDPTDLKTLTSKFCGSIERHRKETKQQIATATSEKVKVK
jgi:hypothetical protein